MLNHIWVSLSEANWFFQNVWFVAAIWMGLALLASLVSIWAGASVALTEILVGVMAGNFLHLHASNEWINFLALLGSGVLTFLAGAEIDPRSLKANLRASALIGVISFAVPFAIVWLFAQFVLGWELHQAQIAGTVWNRPLEFLRGPLAGWNDPRLVSLYLILTVGVLYAFLH